MFRKLFTRTSLFWLVVSAFMLTSMLQGAKFFDLTGETVTGYAICLFLDLVVVVLIHAFLEARYRRDTVRSVLFVVFIIACSATSFYANLAVSLQAFHASLLLQAPLWVRASAPYVLAS